MYTVMKTNDITHTGSYSTAQLELDTHTRVSFLDSAYF